MRIQCSNTRLQAATTTTNNNNNKKYGSQITSTKAEIPSRAQQKKPRKGLTKQNEKGHKKNSI